MVVRKLVKTLYCQKEPNNKMMKCFKEVFLVFHFVR